MVPHGPLAAQADADTTATVLVRGVHPWLGGEGRFVDVQRVVRELREADSAPTLRWSEPAGAPKAAARAALAHILGDPESPAADRADAARLDSIGGRLPTAAHRALFDVAVDVAVARHASLHRQGRVDPSRVHIEWSLAAPDLDYREVITQLADGRNADQIFGVLEPQAPHYRALVASLAAARAEAADTSIHLAAAPARPVSAGGRYPDAPLLARMLVRLGELPQSFALDRVTNIYTKPMADAVARWQQRRMKSGRARGTLDAATVAALADAYRGRAERIALAIERWRWLPRTYSNEPLVVNLPEFRLHTFSRFQGDSADALSMNVVIGRADSNATPVFSANMTQVVFSPRWYVPKSIMLGEILPAASGNAGYLSRHNYELTTPGGRLLPNTAANIAKIGTKVFVRQRSGDANSLGKVKFLLPNQYDIYLHDTPSRSLFARGRRDFSHGCVRLGNPMAMAKYVLASQPVWTEEKITEAMNAGTERYVRVQRPIPVLIVYQTTVAEPDGSLRFFSDIYGHDRTLSAALEKTR